VRKRWLAIVVVLLLAVPLVLLLRGYARDVVLARLLFIGWWARILFESQPQVRIWTVFLVIALLIALRAVLWRQMLPRRLRPAGLQRPGRISILSRRIQQSVRGSYFDRTLSNAIRALSLEVLAHQHRIPVRELRSRLASAKVAPPPELEPYLDLDQSPLFTGRSGFLANLRSLLPSKERATTTQAELDRAVDFLEARLKMSAPPPTGPQPGRAVAQDQIATRSQVYAEPEEKDDR
jgi:hypothetical protein